MTATPEELAAVQFLAGREAAAADALAEAERLKPSAFVRYDEAGDIVQWGSMAAMFIDEGIASGERIANGGGGPDFWYDFADGVVKPKTECQAYLDGLVIRDCPVPCRVHIGLDTYACEDGTAELEFTQPGTYSVTVKSVRYLPKTFVVVIP